MTLAATVPREAKALVDDTAFVENEREFLINVVSVIDTHGRYLKQTV